MVDGKSLREVRDRESERGKERERKGERKRMFRIIFSVEIAVIII